MRQHAALLLAGVVVVGLPLAGRWMRRHAPPRCGRDGQRVDPYYRVRIVDSQGTPHTFCSVRCLDLWLERVPEKPRSIQVTDEATGEEIDAAEAWYVESAVITNRITGNDVHVFRNHADAEDHARDHAGSSPERGRWRREER